MKKLLKKMFSALVTGMAWQIVLWMVPAKEYAWLRKYPRWVWKALNGLHILANLWLLHREMRRYMQGCQYASFHQPWWRRG